MNLNKILLGARLTRDPQLKYLPSQTALVEFGVATSHKYKKGEEWVEEPCFLDVTAFGKIAEVINQHFHKGSPIFIEGRMKWDSWEDKQGGGKRSKLSVVLENFQFVGPRQDGERTTDRSSDQTRTAPRRQAAGCAPSSRPQPNTQPQADFTEDSIPF